MNSKKKTGSYYTPLDLADFIVQHLKPSLNDTNSILEPSVGDGAFIKTIIANNIPVNQISIVDINDEHFKNIQSIIPQEININTYKEDFLEYNNENKLFSLIIGNPPYIKKNLLQKAQIDSCKSILTAAGLKSSAKNIWTAFFIKSISLLDKNGILAMVLPAELLQVSFAEELRHYILNKFQRIEIITFDNLLFECKGQNTIIFIGYKESKNNGVYFSNIENLSDKKLTLNQNNYITHSPFKWSHHYLDTEDLQFIELLCKKIKLIGDYCETKPGIVSAANSYFIINEETENKFHLHKYTLPILQRGLFVNDDIIYTKEAYAKLIKEGKPSKILCFTEDNTKNINSHVQSYLNIGSQMDFVNGWKCSKRKIWYIIPNISTIPDAFFFKRCHQYPKLLINEAQVYVTDSAYKICMKTGFDLSSFIYSFYNTLTIVCSELFGRYYGGGVLELIPSEFKRLPIPYVAINEKIFQQLYNRAKKAANITEILQENDNYILKDNLKLTEEQIIRLQKIRTQLYNKRLKL